MYFDKAGNKITDVLSWGKLLKDREYSTVKQDSIGLCFISTVWLGLGHSHGDVLHAPLIFETMVLGSLSKNMWSLGLWPFSIILRITSAVFHGPSKMPVGFPASKATVNS